MKKISSAHLCKSRGPKRGLKTINNNIRKMCACKKIITFGCYCNWLMHKVHFGTFTSIYRSFAAITQHWWPYVALHNLHTGTIVFKKTNPPQKIIIKRRKKQSLWQLSMSVHFISEKNVLMMSYDDEKRNVQCESVRTPFCFS